MMKRSKCLAAVLTVMCCGLLTFGGKGYAEADQEKPYTVDLRDGYYHVPEDFPCDPDTFSGDQRLDVDGDGSEDVLFRFRILNAGDPYQWDIVPLPGGSVSGKIGYTMPVPFVSLTGTRYHVLEFLFPESPVADTYPVTVSGGYAKDADDTKITEAAPGQRIYIYADAVDGGYVKDWKAEGLSRFSEDYPMDGYFRVAVTMPAHALNLSPLIAAQTPKTYGHDSVLEYGDGFTWLSEAAGKDLQAFQKNDLDGDGYADIYLSAQYSSYSLVILNYNSFCGAYTLPGKTSGPYGPITVDFPKHQYPFEVDLSGGSAPAYQYEFYNDLANCFSWCTEIYGMAGDPNRLDFDRNGTADCLLSETEDEFGHKRMYLFILSTYSLGDVYTLPKADHPEFIPFTFVLNGQGINPMVDENEDPTVYRLDFTLSADGTRWECEIPEGVRWLCYSDIEKQYEAFDAHLEGNKIVIRAKNIYRDDFILEASQFYLLTPGVLNGKTYEKAEVHFGDSLVFYPITKNAGLATNKFGCGDLSAAYGGQKVDLSLRVLVTDGYIVTEYKSDDVVLPAKPDEFNQISFIMPAHPVNIEAVIEPYTDPDEFTFTVGSYVRKERAGSQFGSSRPRDLPNDGTYEWWNTSDVDLTETYKRKGIGMVTMPHNDVVVTIEKKPYEPLSVTLYPGRNELSDRYAVACITESLGEVGDVTSYEADLDGDGTIDIVCYPATNQIKVSEGFRSEEPVVLTAANYGPYCPITITFKEQAEEPVPIANEPENVTSPSADKGKDQDKDGFPILYVIIPAIILIGAIVTAALIYTRKMRLAGTEEADETEEKEE